MIIEPDTHRKFSRINIDHEVSLEFVRDNYDSCRIKNLSITGMFATGNFKKQGGKYCLINLFQDKMPYDLCLQASAKVVRESDEGIALEFTSMPYDSYIFLQTLLLSEPEEFSSKRHLLQDEDCPFELTDQLPISQEESWLTFLQ